MKLKFKNNFAGYFLFYYRILGNKLFINLFLSIVISFLDGIGLAMFMPLLQSVGGTGKTIQNQSMGGLHYITDFIQKLGFSLTVEVVLAVLVILFVFKGIMKFFQLYYQVNIRHSFLKTVRYTLVDSLQNISYTGFLKLDVGRIQNSFTAEVDKVYQGMNAYFNAAQAFVMLITYITLAFMANYQFAILVALGAALSNFLYRKIYNATKKISVQISKKASNFNSYLVQAIFNFKYLKSTSYFSVFSKKLKTVINESEALTRKTGFYNAISTSSKEPLIILIVVGVIEIQLKFIGASLTSILLSLLLFYRSLTYLMVIQTYWQNFIANTGSMQAVASILEEMDGLKEETKGVPFTGIEDHIHLNKIDYKYHEQKKVLDGINIKIKKNNTVAFVGESGSGKTTLANIIIGLLKIQQGEILLDNQRMEKYDLNSYRSKIGYISQEPVIFNDTIFNNITFWSEQTPEVVERFWKIIELASLDKFIEGQPLKEKTILGDNGILISGGQKQRISIARELYRSVEILIMDEATSALDSETEKIIQENIEKLHGTYTIIIIAHRLSTIKNADMIYVLEGGTVMSNGTFSELVSRSDRFKRMVELQAF